MKISTEAKVGFFVFIGILILTYMSFQVGEFRVGGKAGRVLYLVFDSVAGLSEDASVQVAGVEVGKVFDIRLENGKARVAVRVNPDLAIPRDSTAFIRAAGLLGDKFVEISLGTSGQLLKGGETLVAPPGNEEIGKLVGKLSSIADDMKAVSSSLKNVLGGEKGERTVAEIVENFRELSANLNRVIETNSVRFSRILKNIDELNVSLNKTIEENRRNFTETLQHSRSASRSLDSIFRKVDQGQGTLGRLVNEDDISENLKNALVSANDVLGVKKKYRTYVSLRSEELVEENDSKGYVSLKLQPRKDKFYLFELVSPEGTKGDFSESVTKRRITNTGAGAGSAFFPTDVTQTIHTQKTSDRLMYTAMFGRTFGQTSYRIGLEESTGGIGVDHTTLGNRLGLHFDIWDFQGENSLGGSAHAKFRADFNFLKYFYLNAGVDNLFNREDSSLFYGAGIEFRDEDIKDLIGFISIRK